MFNECNLYVKNTLYHRQWPLQTALITFCRFQEHIVQLQEPLQTALLVLCRITAMGLVPIAPAQCCKTCLSKTIHPLDSCSDLNFCSGHGVCNLGSCDCLDGFAVWPRTSPPRFPAHTSTFALGLGVCNLGSCDCQDGFGGPNCSAEGGVKESC